LPDVASVTVQTRIGEAKQGARVETPSTVPGRSRHETGRESRLRHGNVFATFGT
jgi:hypothetical protein